MNYWIVYLNALPFQYRNAFPEHVLAKSITANKNVTNDSHIYSQLFMLRTEAKELSKEIPVDIMFALAR